MDTTPRLLLAQANVARLRVPVDEPVNAPYVERLDEMNLLADRSPGFVWRYVTDSRDPAQREFDDPLMLFNMSVWSSLEALHAYAYRTAHAEVYAGRKAWFQDLEGTGLATLACWWIAEGERPSPDDAKKRLAHLKLYGPTPFAFTLKQAFDSGGELSRLRVR